MFFFSASVSKTPTQTTKMIYAPNKKKTKNIQNQPTSTNQEKLQLYSMWAPTHPPKKNDIFQSSRPLGLNTISRISEVPGFHQLPKRLCAFARVAVRCAVALGMPVRGRLGPASLGRAGALAGRGKRLDLKGKLKGKVTEKGWKISQLVVFSFSLVASWRFSSCTKTYY